VSEFEFFHLVEELHKYGADARDAARRNLGSKKRGRNNNWGVTKHRRLQKSMTYDIKVNGQEITLGIGASGKSKDYAPFVERGVNGTLNQHGSPYSYTNKQPPVGSILQWMKDKPVRLRNSKGEFIEQTPERMKSRAFQIARSIKRKGVPPLFFTRDGIEWARKKHDATIARAAAMDVQVYMRNNLNMIPKL
jgi:hypothetical protein